MVGSIHLATGVTTVAYVVLALAAVTGTVVTIWYARRTNEHRIRVHQETLRLDVYTEFVSALAKTRSAGHIWHKAVADLAAIPRSPAGFFSSTSIEQVKQTAEGDDVRKEREEFFNAIDSLWNASSKVSLVGPSDVADVAEHNVTAYDPRQRNLPPAHIEAFALNPGYPLAGASERRNSFVVLARAQLQYLADLSDQETKRDLAVK